VRKTRARAIGAGSAVAGLAATLALCACSGPALLSLGGELPPPSERFLSPTGDDTNPGTMTSPWKTFAHALPLLMPGWTLQVLPGTYERGTTGTLNVRCADAGPTSTVPNATLASNGTSGSIITVHAWSDRLAFLRGDGRVPPISIESCHDWTIEDFYAESADVDTHATNPDTGAVAVLDGDNQDVALRRLLLRHANRYFAHAHLIRIGDGASRVIVENNELYDFHASAIEAWRSDSHVIAQNYINSRDWPDLADADMKTADGARGDYGVRLQETSSVKVENNIVEDVNTSFAVVGRDEGVDPATPLQVITDNRLLGNVAYRPASIGFVIDSQCAGQNPCDSAHTVNGTYLENDVAYQGGIGIYDAGSLNTKVEEASIIDAARGVYIWKDMSNAAIQATCSVRDTLALGFQSVAFAAGNNQTSWTFDHCAASGGYNTSYYYEPDSAPNVTNKVTVTPGALGSCIVYLPANSMLRMGGATVGANIVYQYDDLGQPTKKSVWGPPFVGCGAIVPDVNDSSRSCSNVLTKLNVNMGTCGLPL
jgi:hypothetical protein